MVAGTCYWRWLMRRDPHLVRALLLHFESKPDDQVDSKPQIGLYTDLEIGYHMILLHEAGYLRCEIERTKSSNRVIKVHPFSLTWQGHDFLDAARNDKVWKKALSLGQKKLGSLPFDVLNSLLLKL